MTSNVGTREIKDFGNGIGFRTSTSVKEQSDSIVRKALNKQFSPEFLNRIDDIINFNSLTRESILKIIDIELKSFFSRVQASGNTLTITDEAKQFVADKGFDSKFGARPLKRAIQTHIEDPLAELMLKNEGKTGSMTIDVQNGEIVSTFTPCE